MPELSFNQINELMQQHFANETYAEGLALADRALFAYPERVPLINYWRMCLAVQMDVFDQANHILEEMLAAGTWYSQAVLRQSPALGAIQGNIEFERLVRISLQMQELDPKEHTPVLVLRHQDHCNPGAQPGCPLLLFIHGNHQNALAHLEHWQPLSQQGWLVALPQSKHALWAEAHVWMDHDSAAEQIVHQYNQLQQQYAIDTDRVILAGFAMGAEVALAMALKGRIVCNGFIVLSPVGPLMGDLKNWRSYLQPAQSWQMRGVIVIGEADDSILPQKVHQFCHQLNQHGIHSHLHSIPKLGHDYPPDFGPILQEAIKFIIG